MQASRSDCRWPKASNKGIGFVQPLAAHDHWHVDVSYINLAGTFYFLTSILDGYSRFIVQWECRAQRANRGTYSACENC
jgi:transposase InsO family protein